MTGAELKTLREGLNLSAQEMADILDIKAERSVRRWEDGSRPVPDDVAERVQVMDGQVDEIAGMLQANYQKGTLGSLVLLRFEKEIDYTTYHSPTWSCPHGHRLHAAALWRFLRLPKRPHREARLVSMCPEAYESWRFQAGFEDDPETRAAWASTQISK
jgi:transcriptional regulator with XRE-family HTH domain